MHHPSQQEVEQSLPLSGHLKLPCSFGSGVEGLPWAHPLEAEVGVEEAEEVGVEAVVEELVRSSDSPDSQVILEKLRL